MIGYVKTCKSELKVRDYEIYRGVYCSLCNALGRLYTPIARLLLSYDFAFAAIFRLALSESGCTFTRKRCPLNPAKKCFFCEKRDETDMAAHATVITAYYKIKDNISDKETGKKLLSILLLPMISLMHRKAKRCAPEVESIIADSIKKQEIAEGKNDCCLDEAADASAEALGKIFALGFEGDEYHGVYRAGYLTGRLVYILDAADDLDKDIKTGNFNPFISKYNELGRDEFKAFVRQIISRTQVALSEAKDDIGFRRFKEIADNVLLDGLEFSAKKIISKYEDSAEIPKTFTVK